MLLKRGSYNFKLNLKLYIEVCEVILYLYSRKPATEKGAVFCNFAYNFFIYIADILKLKNFQNTDRLQINYW